MARLICSPVDDIDSSPRETMLPRRVVIVVGHLAIGAGNSIVELAEALDCPIVEMLDAKGIVDEGHPLVLGVTGIFGNPGLEAPRAAIFTADMVIAFGVTNGDIILQVKWFRCWNGLDLLVSHTLRLQDGHSIQVHTLVEIQPDSYADVGAGWQPAARINASLNMTAKALTKAVTNLLGPDGSGALRNAITDESNHRDEMMKGFNSAFGYPKVTNGLGKWRKRATQKVDASGHAISPINLDTTKMWSYWYGW
eukprot:scaffold1594_cov401-Prasinococcus_capsulatus_cf.AAC.54